MQQELQAKLESALETVTLKKVVVAKDESLELSEISEPAEDLKIRWSGDDETELDRIITYNWTFPEHPSYERHIIGVSNYNDGFQFIFSDQTRTTVDQSGCEEIFHDYVIPKGSVIAKVQMMTDAYDDEPSLVGLKFLSVKGKTLMSAGLIDKPSRINNPNFPVEEIVLSQGERIVGVKSRQDGEKSAIHYNLKMLIAKP